MTQRMRILGAGARSRRRYADALAALPYVLIPQGVETSGGECVLLPWSHFSDEKLLNLSREGRCVLVNLLPATPGESKWDGEGPLRASYDYPLPNEDEEHLQSAGGGRISLHLGTDQMLTAKRVTSAEATILLEEDLRKIAIDAFRTTPYRQLTPNETEQLLEDLSSLRKKSRLQSTHTNDHLLLRNFLVSQPSDRAKYLAELKRHARSALERGDRLASGSGSTEGSVTVERSDLIQGRTRRVGVVQTPRISREKGSQQDVVIIDPVKETPMSGIVASERTRKTGVAGFVMPD